MTRTDFLSRDTLRRSSTIKDYFSSMGALISKATFSPRRSNVIVGELVQLGLSTTSAEYEYLCFLNAFGLLNWEQTERLKSLKGRPEILALYMHRDRQVSELISAYIEKQVKEGPLTGLQKRRYDRLGAERAASMNPCLRFLPVAMRIDTMRRSLFDPRFKTSDYGLT